jgi:pyruvate/2-oxoglutarate dehydrogenase complex dihydrolipoamide dehydrogenase (E3) component
MARFLAWLEAGARDAGVALRLDTDADAAGLAGTADVFVQATGARRRPVFAAAASGPRVVAVDGLAELLDGADAPRRVAVHGSDVIAVKAAEALAQAGHAVTVLEGPAFAPEMGLPRRWRAADLLARHGCARVKRVVEVTPVAGGVRYRAARDEGELACDVLLDAGGLEADDALATALRVRGADAIAIGDCRGPRYLEAGLLEAARLAQSL